MFIREVKKQRSKTSQVFFQYNLVQAARVDGKVKQRVILYLGSDQAMKDKNNRNAVLDVLKAKIYRQPELFPAEISRELKNLALSYYQKYLIKYGDQPQDDQVSLPPQPQKAEFHNIDILGMEVCDVKSFGPEHLCRQVLDKLQLKECFTSLGMTHQEADKALIAIAARAIFCESEHKTAQILNMNSELAACYGQNSNVNHKQLYQVADQIYEHKEKIDQYLYQRVTDMFDINDKLVIFDISNTYFETNKANSKLAKHGRSKEKRNDCPLVVFTGVINAQGFIRHSRIYEGNLSDTRTIEEMIADLALHGGSAKKQTIVIDAGIATEDNLQMIKEKGYDYVCVSRKRIKDYPLDEDKKVVKLTARGKQRVELSIFQPEGHTDTWMYVQSQTKRNKEQSMSRKLSARFLEDLQNIRDGFNRKGGTKKVEKVWERIGRIKQKHNRVSGRYEITLNQKDGQVIDMQWKIKPDPVKDEKENGVYFIRTSHEKTSEEELWNIYNLIREVESTFRCLKSDLQMRPVHHQNDKRIESHLYLTILAYQLVNTIRHMLGNHNIRYDWRNILRIMSTQTIQTIQMPTDKKNIHLRKPAKPIKEVQEIYRATGCIDTQKPVKKYVVYH
jgi:hypothetical protein